MCPWKSWHLIAQPERSSLMLKSVHRRGQSWAGGLSVELRIDDFGLLGEREQRHAEQQGCMKIALHG
jgi:hypothetical protein